MMRHIDDSKLLATSQVKDLLCNLRLANSGQQVIWHIVQKLHVVPWYGRIAPGWRRCMNPRIPKKGNSFQVFKRNATSFKGGFKRFLGKTGVMLFPGIAFFLDCEDGSTINNHRGRGIITKIQAKDFHLSAPKRRQILPWFEAGLGSILGQVGSQVGVSCERTTSELNSNHGTNQGKRRNSVAHAHQS